jgi:hypothetical protein
MMPMWVIEEKKKEKNFTIKKKHLTRENIHILIENLVCLYSYIVERKNFVVYFFFIQFNAFVVVVTLNEPKNKYTATL